MRQSHKPDQKHTGPDRASGLVHRPTPDTCLGVSPGALQ